MLPRRRMTIFHGMTRSEILTGLTLTINGEKRTIGAGSTVESLLQDLDLNPRLLIVERNREILRDRDSYAGISLEDGDVLELVHFVGGG